MWNKSEECYWHLPESSGVWWRLSRKRKNNDAENNSCLRKPKTIQSMTQKNHQNINYWKPAARSSPAKRQVKVLVGAILQFNFKLKDSIKKSSFFFVRRNSDETWWFCALHIFLYAAKEFLTRETHSTSTARIQKEECCLFLSLFKLIRLPSTRKLCPVGEQMFYRGHLNYLK